MKKIVLAMMLVAAVTAVAQTTPAPAQAAPQPQRPRQLSRPPRTLLPEKRDQRSGRIQRLRGRRAADGCRRQDQRTGSVSDAVSEQRDEGRRAGALDERLPADGQRSQRRWTRRKRFLQTNPCNMRALALIAYTKQAMATAGQNAATEFCRRRASRRKGIAVSADGDQAAMARRMPIGRS